MRSCRPEIVTRNRIKRELQDFLIAATEVITRTDEVSVLILYSLSSKEPVFMPIRSYNSQAISPKVDSHKRINVK
jgi:hypothetical protein